MGVYGYTDGVEVRALTNVAWVEFPDLASYVYLLCTERILPGPSVFPSPQRPTFD